MKRESGFGNRAKKEGKNPTDSLSFERRWLG
jgi:hypothetical protein